MKHSSGHNFEIRYLKFVCDDLKELCAEHLGVCLEECCGNGDNGE